MSHVDPFNALGGFSVGIPPELVIDEDGNVVNNVNAPNANVTANRVYANYYYFANGAPLSIGASGSNTQVQYNFNGVLGASSAFTFNSSTSLLTVSKIQATNSANLGNIANIVILGGTNGYFLQTDGEGNLTWAPAGNGTGGNGSPGGANTQVQFNNAGNFGGDAGFIYNNTINLLTVGNITTANITADYITLNWDVTANVVIANYLYGDGSNISNVVAVSAAVANSVAGANVTGQVGFANVANNVAGANVTGQVGFAAVANSVAASNITGQVANALVAGTVYTAAQPNITTVGNLLSLTVIGNITSGNANLGNSVNANFYYGNLFGTANIARHVSNASQPNITSVGTLTSLNVTGNTVLGNSVVANYFVGSLYGTANVALIANTANQANIANTAASANYAEYANNTNFTNVANYANEAFSVNASNILGQVANALVAGTVYTNAQPNITSLGTLTILGVSGNITAANITANTGRFSGNGSGLHSIVGSNVTGQVNFAATANSVAGANVTGTVATATLATTATTATTAGTVTTNSQPNITSIGTLTSLTVSGVSNLGNVANFRLTGGVNGYVLSTDGAGNLSWVAQTGNGGGGNGTPGGANTNIQFNDNGNFAGSNKFSWNNLSDVLYVGGTTNISGNLTANRVTANSANISGNVTVGNLTGANLVSANFLSGTLTTNSQANINYLGNIAWLNVDSSLPMGNGNIRFNGSLRGVGSASDINITGNVDAGRYVQADELVGNITVAAQPNITSLGTLTSLNVNGTANLGNVGNVKINGGSNNFVLSTDGTGNLNWVPQVSGNINPGGLNTYIQFNNSGNFDGSQFFTWNNQTRGLFIGGNANVNGFSNASVFVSNVANGTAPFVVFSSTPVPNLAVETAGTVRNAAQPNITSVGNLTALTVSGNILANNANVTNTFTAGNITTTGVIGTTNLNVTGNANLSNNVNVTGSATLTVNGKFNSAGSSNVNLGNISNIHISGGINGYVLATDGGGNLYWSAGGGGGNGTPGGSNTQIQYNDNGAFNGSAFFTFNEDTSTVQVAGNLVANTVIIGAGAFEFSQSNVFFATTSSTAANQVILSIPAANTAAVDYTIISTDVAGGIRNFIKISTVKYGNTINYVEYSTLPVNGYTGDFTVEYNPGNMINPASIQLRLTPQTANSMTHKMMITAYKE